MCSFKNLFERQTFRHFGVSAGLVKFDVKCEWTFGSDECRVSCNDNEGVEIYEELNIVCDPSDRGEILKVSWNYLCECDMLEGRLYHTESHFWIVESEGKLYAVLFDEAEKRGCVEYTINRLPEPSSNPNNDYSVEKGTKQIDIENREELLDCVESLIDEYQKAGTR